MMRSQVFHLASFVLALVVAAACGGSDEPPPEIEEFTVEGSVMEALDNYAFATDLSISTEEGDLELSFEGGFQAPDRIQGAMSVEGSYADETLEWLERPSNTETIIVPEEAWWREPGGEWRYGEEPYDSVDPFVGFAQYAMPRFYLEGLVFDSLVVPVDGPPEEVNGTYAYHVVLARQAILDLLPQGTGVRFYLGDDPNSNHEYILENADYWLPEDFAVDVWFAADGGYPTRIVIEFGGQEGRGLFEGDTRLQMDITDPDADFDIEIPDVAPTPSAD